VIALLPLGDLVLALSRDGLLTVRARACGCGGVLCLCARSV
jgi:hypothetical protein